MINTAAYFYVTHIPIAKMFSSETSLEEGDTKVACSILYAIIIAQLLLYLNPIPSNVETIDRNVWQLFAHRLYARPVGNGP